MEITMPVFLFLDSDGATIGCGTAAELDELQAEGILAANCCLGARIF